MRLITWTVRLILFVALLAFAVKNVEPVTVRFYFDASVQVPLVVVVFACFAGGALAGLLAVLGTLLRQRRRIWRLRQDLQKRSRRITGIEHASRPGLPQQ